MFRGEGGCASLGAASEPSVTPKRAEEGATCSYAGSDGVLGLAHHTQVASHLARILDANMNKAPYPTTRVSRKGASLYSGE